MKNWKNALFAALAAGFMTLGLFTPALADHFGVYVNPGYPYYSGYDAGYYDPYLYGYRRTHHWSPYTGYYGDPYGGYYYHHRSDAARAGRLVGSILDWVF